MGNPFFMQGLSEKIMELNADLYIATFDHAPNKLKFNMEPKEIGEKNVKNPS